MTRQPGRSRLRRNDALATALGGLRARPVRACLSALGVALGIAAGIGVVGLSASSRAGLLARLGAQADVLTVSAGQTFSGQPAPLPAPAEGMVSAIPPVVATTAVAVVPGVTVRRSAAVPAVDTGGISVLATDLDLPATLATAMARGTFLNAATERYPAVVLGYGAAEALGVDHASVGTQVFLGAGYFSVVGILGHVPLAPEIDEAALVGFPAAESLLGLPDARATTIYLRTDPDRVAPVAALLPFTANPQQPEGVQVSRPSDILLARAAARGAYSALLLGLGALAVVVGGVGIANVMVIAVLERRNEIGLRRALGARRLHIAAQFLLESSLLALLGGIAGALLGVVVVEITALAQGQPAAVPLAGLCGGLAATVGVGTAAGAYPAGRAARLSPAEALRTG